MAETAQSVERERLQQPPKAASTARFELPVEGFALGEVFERVSDARIELVSTIAGPTDMAIVVVRADDSTPTEIDSALGDDATVTAVEYIGERPDGRAYQVEWSDRPRHLIRRLTAEGITLLSIRGRASRWVVRVVAPDRDLLTRANEILTESGCEAECRRISTFGTHESDHRALTKKQHEALVEAFEAGYYDIPRNIGATDLAEHLDITHQALSERLRRAHTRLVGNELFGHENRSA